MQDPNQIKILIIGSNLGERARVADAIAKYAKWAMTNAHSVNLRTEAGESVPVKRGTPDRLESVRDKHIIVTIGEMMKKPRERRWYETEDGRRAALPYIRTTIGTLLVITWFILEYA